MPPKGLGHLEAAAEGEIGLLRHRMGELVHSDKQLGLQQLHRHGDFALDEAQDGLGGVVNGVAQALARLLVGGAGHEGHAEGQHAHFGREVVPGVLELALKARPLDDGEPSVDAVEVQRDGLPDTGLVDQDVKEGAEGQRVDVLGGRDGAEEPIVRRVLVFAGAVCPGEVVSKRREREGGDAGTG